MRDLFKGDKWAPQGRGRGPEYDHPSGSVEHDNRNSFRSANTSYNLADLVATPPGLNRDVGNARNAQERALRYGLLGIHDSTLSVKGGFTIPMSASASDLTMANNMTLLKLLDVRQEGDLSVVAQSDVSEFNKFGITKEDTISSKNLVFAQDRGNIMNLKHKLGLASHVEVCDLSLVNNVNKSATHCVEELYIICENVTPQQIQNPKFVRELSTILSELWTGKKFNEGVRSNYHPSSQVCHLMRASEAGFKEQLSFLLRLFQDKGLDIRVLHTYDPSLDIGGYDSETFLYGKAPTEEQMVSRETLDFLATQIDATKTTTGRHRILSKKNVLLKALTIESAQSPPSESLTSTAPPESAQSPPSESLTITAPPEDATNQSTRQGVRLLQSSSTTSRQGDTKPLSRRGNSSKVDNSRALIVAPQPNQADR